MRPLLFQGYGAVYQGMLAAENWDHKKGEYVCMSKEPEGVGSAGNENGVCAATLH